MSIIWNRLENSAVLLLLIVGILTQSHGFSSSEQQNVEKPKPIELGVSFGTPSVIHALLGLWNPWGTPLVARVYSIPFASLGIDLGFAFVSQANICPYLVASLGTLSFFGSSYQYMGGKVGIKTGSFFVDGGLGDLGQRASPSFLVVGQRMLIIFNFGFVKEISF